MQLKIEMKFDKKLVDDLLVTAYEGGSSYWFNDEGHMVDHNEHTYPFGSKITFSDGRELDITSELLQRGLEVLQAKAPHLLANIVNDRWDAIDADAYFQAVVLGDLIYG